MRLFLCFDLVLDNCLSIHRHFLNCCFWILIWQSNNFEMLSFLVELEIKSQSNIFAWAIKDYLLMTMLLPSEVLSTIDDKVGRNYLGVDNHRQGQKSYHLDSEFKHFLNFYIILKSKSQFVLISNNRNFGESINF